MVQTGPKRYPKSARSKDAVKTIARAYADVNVDKPLAHYDDTLEVHWGAQELYEVMKQIGKGKYGDVFESVNLRNRSMCVVKIMKPVRESRLRREIKILNLVSGGPNIVQLLDLVRDPETKTPTFVFERVEATDYRELLRTVTDIDVRFYLYQLLTALEFTHSKGIMHRDVKPANVLIDHKRRLLRLIDWGLADFYFPAKPYPVRVATRYYKSPEIICDIREYDYSMDMWAVGCTLGSMLFRLPVMFRGEDEFDQLVKIAKVLGTDELYKFTTKYGVDLDLELAALIGRHPRKPWREFITKENADLNSPAALDLLDKLLKYDHQERLTAAEALQHPYFDPVRS